MYVGLAMAIRFNRTKVLRGVVLGVSAAGVVHFLSSLAEWGTALAAASIIRMRGGEIYFHMFIDAIPTIVLLGGFFTAGVFAWKKKKGAGLILIWSIIATGVFFAYDATNNNWQMQVMTPDKRCHFRYYNWPWYNNTIKNSRWGYIDRTGCVVAAPQMESDQYFSEGLAAVEIDDKWGYIDEDGQIVIEPQFDWGSDFSEGLAVVGTDAKYGYIDVDGEVVIEPQFVWADDFSEGLARVENDDKRGFIDRTGKFLNRPHFDKARRFSGGLAAIRLDSEYGYIDKTGKVVIAVQFYLSRDFSDGLAAAMKKFGQKWGYIDKTGEFVIPPKFDYAGSFTNGRARVKKVKAMSRPVSYLLVIGFGVGFLVLHKRLQYYSKVKGGAV